jgi:hypothetical protein
MKKLLLLILALVLISGCATNECVDDLDVLNNIFGIEGARLVSSEICETCSPWYSPVVKEFEGVIEKDGKMYGVAFSTTCYRHEADTYEYCISSEEKDELYLDVKDKICENLDFLGEDVASRCIQSDHDTIDLFVECLQESYNMYEGYDVDDGKELCEEDINCFAEYVNDGREDFFENYCDNFEVEDDGVMFSIYIPNHGWDETNTKIGDSC